jgi:hypothetical protein
VISEGINLQRYASNIIHYELPWNPNRLEQRNGRIDRIGQLKDEVHIRTMIMKDSMEISILELLIKKAETIRKDRGYSGAYFGDESNLAEMIKVAHQTTRAKRKKKIEDKNQLLLKFGVDQPKEKVSDTKLLDKAISKKYKDPFDKETIERIEKESFYDSIDISLPDIDKRIEETHRIIGSKEEVNLFVRSAMNYLKCKIDERSDGFLSIHLSDKRLQFPIYGNVLEKVSFDPEDGLSYPDVRVLELGHPIIRRLIEIIKAEFFSISGAYGRNAAFFSENTESICFVYNALVRFTVGRTEKRVIEELITFAVDSFDNSLLPEEKTAALVPAKTTQKANDTEVMDLIAKALNESLYLEKLNLKIEERKNKLITERQELAKKIYRETKHDDDAKWVDEIVFIEKASQDLLTVTIVYPL